MPANFRRTCILLLAFLHAPFPLVSFGQQTAASSPGIVQLTPKQAVQLALHQNPQRIIARRAMTGFISASFPFETASPLKRRSKGLSRVKANLHAQF